MREIGQKRISYIASGTVLLVIGLLFYAFFRDVEQTYIKYLLGSGWLNPHLADSTFSGHVDFLGNVPSFLHVLGFSYLTAGLIRADRRGLFAASLAWLAINSLIEFGQLPSAFNIVPTINGVFDWSDIIASVLAFFTVNIFMFRDAFMQSVHEGGDQWDRAPKKLLIACVFVAGVGSIMGSIVICDEDEQNCPHPKSYQPVYLAYAELRSAIKTENDAPLENIGKIYLYQDYLFVNSKNEGVHVFDNHNPTKPLHITFVRIPGNIDIAIKDGYLYVDSYIDLVALDIRDVNNIREVHRIEKVFPYDAYQNIPEGIFLNSYDEKAGVVIGYKETGNAH